MRKSRVLILFGALACAASIAQDTPRDVKPFHPLANGESARCMEANGGCVAMTKLRYAEDLRRAYESGRKSCNGSI